jgi:hypothetical protein
MLPDVGRSRPPMIFSSVLLPAPLGPTTATISPSSIPNVTPATAGRPPKRFVTASTSRSRWPPGYDGRYGVRGLLFDRFRGHQSPALFSAGSGGGPLVRTVRKGVGPTISPHAVHFSGNAYPG